MKNREVVKEPQTIGDHVRKRRLELGLTQQEAATGLGVSLRTVINWEKGYRAPPIRSLPPVLRFLGYDPFPEPQTIGDRLAQVRRQHGWSTTEAAHHLGVDQKTWQDWEHGEIILFRKHRARVSHLLQLDPDALDREMRARWNGKHRRWEK